MRHACMSAIMYMYFPGKYGYTFIYYGHQNQTANQIRRSYKNDKSNIFVTVYSVTWKYNRKYMYTM